MIVGLVLLGAVLWSSGTPNETEAAEPAPLSDTGPAPDDRPLREPAAARYDLATTLTITGPVYSAIVAPAGSILFLQGTDSNGDSRLWAVEGDSAAVHREDGWRLRSEIYIGDTIMVTLYPAKPDTTIEDVRTATAASPF
jgi:hypothetical protein